ncbi:hypothetical protein LOTGIDRAFT_157447 [Lottia gigantea]|uniref:CABIT domain-containing protein n=1 Tax=Lottia gigantea TaxID=225164 RepID=V4B1R8_LOTGI|nr:hypothetical protein LOTGIDRAFT_157447 [Lottia gigantea]ESP01271.1 hypothetical protein LOTGIDRAFT_157447 [Lottia gigantea]
MSISKFTQCKDFLPIAIFFVSRTPLTIFGWFEVVPEDGRPVEYFDTVGGITSVKPKRFLVRTSTVGYQLSVEDGVSCWMPCEIRSGEVLTTGMVYMDNKKSKSHSHMRNLFKKLLKSSKNSKKEQDLKYLQCFDSTGKEIMIPLIMSGVFSPVGESNSANYDAVYELQDLIMAFGLPVSAQLVHSLNKEDSSCPHGVLRLEDSREEEFAYIESVPSGGAKTLSGEIPLDSECRFTRELKRHPRKKREKSEPRLPAEKNQEKTHDREKPQEKNSILQKQQSEIIYSSTSVELPERVERELKKSKSVSLLDKLSVRRTKKERAKLKALREDDVFSKRLSRGEISYEDFYNGLSDEEKDESSLSKTAKSSDNDSETYNKSKHSDTSSVSSPYGVVPPPSIQNRDLPPIPIESSSFNAGVRRDSKESLYERLPAAPLPPNGVNKFDHDEDDGGYMIPKALRQEFDSPYHMRNGGDRSSNTRRGSSPYVGSPNAEQYHAGCGKTGDHECPIDIDNLFSFAYSQDPSAKPYGTLGTTHYRSTSQLYASTPGSRRPWVHNGSESNVRFMDTLDLQTAGKNHNIRYKQRSQKGVNSDPNATIRSHNLRKHKNAMEVFHFTDSFRDLRHGGGADTSSPYGEVPNPVFYIGNDTGIYPESEPGYRARYQRSISTGGIGESFIKQGDDSAISLCSRGDYGYHRGDSDYSYGEYGDSRDDGWSPPDEIEPLTVQEVSKSLRYIGMKDRVVLRFANEQIDGEMLSSLDKKLIKEGFPELNALEIKKILDFVRADQPWFNLSKYRKALFLKDV